MFAATLVQQFVTSWLGRDRRKEMTVPLAVEKPTIKILLYTDNSQFSLSNDAFHTFALGRMNERLLGHAPTFADLSTTLVNRDDGAGVNKIDDVLAKESFDEIWFFGTQQSNTPGEPQSELDIDEVNALRQWMDGGEDNCDGGGVLITGDHADAVPFNLLQNPTNPCGPMSQNVRFLGLGRAIGQCVPRAGLLRKWEGPPTVRTQDSFNTLSGGGIQQDRTPQELFLENVDDFGDPDPSGQPHPLFFYRPGQFIQAFPDHQHEGAVIIPRILDASWPTGSRGQTRPHVVALGRNGRNGDELNIVATYNGNLANVGRIVADSTWHHYVNVNLLGFPHPAPEGSVADQIGQYYANLAVWLAPCHKRQSMAMAMCWVIAHYTFHQAEVGNIDSITEASKSLLSRLAPPCEAHELMQALLPNRADAVAEEARKNNFDSKQLHDLFFANVINLYHEAMIAEQIRTKSQFKLEGTKSKQTSMNALLDEAYERAIAEFKKRLRNSLDALESPQNYK